MFLIRHKQVRGSAAINGTATYLVHMDGYRDLFWTTTTAADKVKADAKVQDLKKTKKTKPQKDKWRDDCKLDHQAQEL